MKNKSVFEGVDYKKDMKIIKTKDCFKGENIYYRDSDLDNWLPEEWQVIEEGKVSFETFTEPMTFLQVCKEFLKTEEPKELLKYSFTLPEIEKMLDSEDLDHTGYANFFLVKEKNKRVSVVYAARFGGRWYVYVSRLDYGHVWGLGGRFFFRNKPSGLSDPLDTSDLETRVKDLEQQMDAIRKFLIF